MQDAGRSSISEDRTQKERVGRENFKGGKGVGGKTMIAKTVESPWG